MKEVREEKERVLGGGHRSSFKRRKRASHYHGPWLLGS